MASVAGLCKRREGCARRIECSQHLVRDALMTIQLGSRMNDPVADRVGLWKTGFVQRAKHRFHCPFRPRRLDCRGFLVSFPSDQEPRISPNAGDLTLDEARRFCLVMVRRVERELDGRRTAVDHQYLHGSVLES